MAVALATSKRTCGQARRACSTILRREVDLTDLEPAVGQARTRVPGPAADVQDDPEAAVLLGEGVERGPRPRVALQQRRNHPRVGVGDPVVGGAHLVQVPGLPDPPQSARGLLHARGPGRGSRSATGRVGD